MVIIYDIQEVFMSAFKNIEGYRFNKIVVQKLSDRIEFVKNNNRKPYRKYYWICKCDCGAIIEACGETIKNHKIKSCSKCSNRGKFQRTKTYYPTTPRITDGDAALRMLMWRTKDRAIIKSLEWNLDFDFLKELIKKQNYKCAISGIKICLADTVRLHRKLYTTASIDRIDSSKGYIIGNIQWVHKTVNNMKGNQTDADFINMCKKIYEFNK
jgi:hypothetical protein